MQQGAALGSRGSSEVIATFRKYGRLVNSDNDTIEWRLFCSVLKHLEPAYYTDGVLDALFQQVRPSAKKVEPNAAIKLEPLIDAIFQPAGAPLVNSSRRSSVASSVGDKAAVLCVHNFTGEAVLSLTRKEVKVLSTVLRLRAEVGKVISRRTEEVNLIAGVQQLQDAETLEALLLEDSVLEVLLAIQQLPQFDPSADPVTQLPALKWLLLSPQRDEQEEAARAYRRVLSVENAPPIDLVIEQGVVPRLLELCQAEDSARLQFESAWALTNVASGNGDQTHAVVQAGAVPVFVRLLQSPNSDVREQAVWALGNIAGDSPQMRDLVLQNGVMQHILRALNEATALSFIRNATWTLSNLCRGKPPPDPAQVLPALDTLSRFMSMADDAVLRDAAWALSYLSDGPNNKEKVEAVLATGVLGRCIALLAHPSSRVQVPVLRMVGNILAGDDDQTQRVLSAGVLPQLRALMGHAKRGIQKESCWAVSNVMAGNQRQIQGVLDAGLVPPLLELLRNAAMEVKREAAWAIANATSGGSLEQIRHLVEVDSCVPPMLEAVTTMDNKLGLVMMTGLENILNAGERLKWHEEMSENPWIALVAEVDGVEEVLWRCLNNGPPEVSHKADTLLTLIQAREQRS